jgi:hypothetical protein
MDLEMHIDHKGQTDKYKETVLAIMFDTRKAEKVPDWVVNDVIDPMFDSLLWD